MRDLGASLGKTSFPKLLDWFPMRGLGQGSRNDVDDFESQGFIKRVEGDRIEFDYRGIHQNVARHADAERRRLDVPVDVAAVRCAVARRLSRGRVFRRSRPPLRRKIKSKVAEGLKLGEG